MTISAFVKDRLNTRISLKEPEKSSPLVLLGSTPFQPRRRVEEEDTENEVIANVATRDETMDPSTYAVRVFVDNEPV